MFGFGKKTTETRARGMTISQRKDVIRKNPNISNANLCKKIVDTNGKNVTEDEIKSLKRQMGYFDDNPFKTF